MSAMLRALLATLVVALSSAAAFADDWVAVRLRGTVLQLVDGEWLKLHRNDVVPDSRVIRTLRTGNVEFVRGEEHVTLGPDTQIQIYDEKRAKPFTTVKQYFGTVAVEAEVRDVQHFAVENRYLAAVVKGTRFTVTASDDGASVEVERGAVFVEDSATRNNVTVTAGQSAAVDKAHRTPVVSGKGIDKKPEPGKTTLMDLLGIVADDDDAVDEPGKGKPAPGDKGRSDDADKPGKGTPHQNGHDNSGQGKSGDNSGKGQSGDNSGKGQSDDNSGKGQSGDNSGKGKSGDNSGKGQSRGRG